MKKKKAKRSKVLRYWKIEEIEKPDGTIVLKRTNKGYDYTELVGLIEITRIDLRDFFRKKLQHKIVRKAIVEVKK